MCAVRRGSGNGLFLSARELLGRPRPAPRGSQRSARRPSAKVATPGTTTGPKRHRSSASPSVSPSASAGSSVAPSASASTPAATASFAPAAAPSPKKCGTGASDAEAVQSGSTWTARRGDTVTYPGEDMAAVVTSATASLGADRTGRQRVVLRGRAACPPQAVQPVPGQRVDLHGDERAVGATPRSTPPACKGYRLAGFCWFSAVMPEGAGVRRGLRRSGRRR